MVEGGQMDQGCAAVEGIAGVEHAARPHCNENVYGMSHSTLPCSDTAPNEFLTCNAHLQMSIHDPALPAHIPIGRLKLHQLYHLTWYLCPMPNWCARDRARPAAAALSSNACTVPV